jgi:hypothetical protein
VCEECRGVLHLASDAAQLPAEQVQAAPAIEPARRLWWLRWASAAAMLLMVAGGLTLWMYHGARPQSETVAMNRRPEPPTASLPQAPAASIVVSKRAVSAPRGHVPTVTSKKEDEARQALAPQAQPEIAEAPAQLSTVPAATPPRPQAKTAFRAEGAAFSHPRAGIMAMQPHWRISADGRLEFAYRDGPWRPALTQEDAKMRVVSVIGNEVWVGGDGTRLYRSADNGVTWTRVALPEKGSAEHAIVRVLFRNAEDGTVEAEDGTVWTTSDGGSTWQ